MPALGKSFSSNESVDQFRGYFSSQAMTTASASSVPCPVSEFRFAVPDPVPGIDPDPATPPTIDGLAQREKDRRDRIDSFDQPTAKFHAMDCQCSGSYFCHL